MLAALGPPLLLERNADEPAATVVARVQKYYDATKDLRAKFEQRSASASRAPSKASGEVWLKKPGKMRWDYAKPDKKLMVSDGATLWVYEPDDEQAYKQDLKGNALPAQVSFLLGEGKLDKEFDASMTKVDGLGADELALKMVPKVGTTAYRYIVFVVDGKSGQVRQTIIYGQDGIDEPPQLRRRAAEQGRRRRQVQVLAARRARTSSSRRRRNLPGRAEAIDDDAERGRPERLRKRHVRSAPPSASAAKIRSASACEAAV